MVKKPVISVIGPGVVGYSLGKVLAKKGFKVHFFGGGEKTRKKVKKDGYTIFDKDEKMDGDYDYDITFLTVPTPTYNGRIDLSHMESAAKNMGERIKKMKKYHLVVVKSTVPPGTTAGLVKKTLEKISGKKAGKDFGLCMNPEYLREIYVYEDTLKPWMILIGQFDKKSGDMLYKVYKGKFKCPIHRSSLTEAEMQKYVHNLYNAAKISFFNEMRQIGKKMKLDVDKVFGITAESAEGMWNKKYGIRDFGPYSGSCLPKDTKAFAEWAQKNDYDIDVLMAVMKANEKLLRKNGYAHLAKEQEYVL